MTRFLSAFATFALVACLMLVSPPPVRAGSHSVDQGEAYSVCLKEMEGWKLNEPNYTDWACEHSEDTQNGTYTLRYTHTSGQRRDADYFTYPLGATCAARSEHFVGMAGPSNIKIDNSGLATRCGRGCEYRFESKTEIIVAGKDSSIDPTFAASGGYKPTGATCGAPAPFPPPKDDVCGETDGGHKLCRNTKGQICVISAKTGRRYCNGPGQPLNATNPDRTENINIAPPAPGPGLPTTPPSPRPGEDWRPGGGGSVTNITNNNSTTTNVTINNQGGTPNTDPGSGNPNDGGENPGEGDDDEDDKGSASGGATCASAPTCTGDPIGCANLHQAWSSRCDGVGDEIPGITEFEQTVLDQAIEDVAPIDEVDGSDGNGDLDNYKEEEELTGAELDASGFLGSATCPSPEAVEIASGAVGFNFSPFCDVLTSVGHLLMALAYFMAFRIIAGGGRK